MSDIPPDSILEFHRLRSIVDAEGQQPGVTPAEATPAELAEPTMPALPTYGSNGRFPEDRNLPFPDRPLTLHVLSALDELSAGEGFVSDANARIHDLTGIPNHLVNRTLDTATCARIPLVAKRPSGKLERSGVPAIDRQLTPAGYRLIERYGDKDAGIAKVIGLERYDRLLRCVSRCMLSGLLHPRAIADCPTVESQSYGQLCGELVLGGYLRLKGYSADGGWYELTSRGKTLVATLRARQTEIPPPCDLAANLNDQPAPKLKRIRTPELHLLEPQQEIIDTYLTQKFAEQKEAGIEPRTTVAEAARDTGTYNRETQLILRQFAFAGDLYTRRVKQKYFFIPVESIQDDTMQWIREWTARLQPDEAKRRKMIVAMYRALEMGVVAIGTEPDSADGTVDETTGKYLIAGPALDGLRKIDQHALLRRLKLEQLVFGYVLTHGEIMHMAKSQPAQPIAALANKLGLRYFPLEA